jgi:hypothetical protein
MHLALISPLQAITEYQSLRNQNTYLVIHIGDIHDKSNIVLEIVSHYSPNYIRTDIVPSVAKMGIIIHCRTASIPRDLSVS